MGLNPVKKYNFPQFAQHPKNERRGASSWLRACSLLLETWACMTLLELKWEPYDASCTIHHILGVPTSCMLHTCITVSSPPDSAFLWWWESYSSMI